MLRQNGTRSYSRVHTIEQGLINETMKKRMNELEEQIKILEDKFTVEEYEKQKELSYEMWLLIYKKLFCSNQNL